VSEEEDERFAGSLRGESTGHPLGRRLGELLRERHERASRDDDEIARRRVWQLIAARIGKETPGAQGKAWVRRAAFAQAAVVAVAGIALGYFLASSVPTTPESRLEFSYGDLEVSRGMLSEAEVVVADPLEAMRPLTEALIGDRIAFEVYSVDGGADRRVLITLPASIPPATEAAFRALNLTPLPGASTAITLRSSSSD